ncbi:RHS repeat-associated core domain-containing protein [Pseudomonas sp. P5_152]|uniref:RHS repeat-associated core domain-containing protein n=1 Tax=Pseudomonas sp. P5_152 TaxID=3043442 RepID=UPI002A35EEDA|nr:RHS repeat-associated core domain-containing protein [Pseudomonas sp. P5_152]MDX9665638.1 RHS repeat-associated core domain-containing protein [Pseudomonas sp. P5_152]
MPVSRRDTVLSRYSYDPLDRQTDCTLLTLPVIQRFYCKSRLATEIQGSLQTSVFQHDDQLLAQQRQQDGKVDTTLLATDQQRSVLGARGLTGSHLLAYSPYGHRPVDNGLLSLLGFNGERPDPLTGHYHLGNGYRQFNPVLMRFNSPDSWSPFGKGGLNAYGYCEGDPRNGADPSGHFKVPVFIKTTNHTAQNHHKAPKPISDSTKIAIYKTANTLGNEQNIMTLARETDKSPELFLFEKTIEGREAKTKKLITFKSSNSRENRENREKTIQHLKKTIRIYGEILIGTREGEFRPENLKDTLLRSKKILRRLEHLNDVVRATS